MSYTTAPYEKNILPWAKEKGYEIHEPLWSEDLRLLQSTKFTLLKEHKTPSKEDKFVRTLEELICKYSLNVFERTIVMPFGKMTISYSSSNPSHSVNNYLDLHNLYFAEPRRVYFSITTELGEPHPLWKTSERKSDYSHVLIMHYLPGSDISFECFIGDKEFEDKGSIFENISGYLSVIDSYEKNPDMMRDLIKSEDE